MAEPTALARAAINGEYTVFLADCVPDGCWLRIGLGTPNWTKIRSYECTGTGPFEAWLGASVDARVRLGTTYAAGTVVEVLDA